MDWMETINSALEESHTRMFLTQEMGALLFTAEESL